MSKSNQIIVLSPPPHPSIGITETIQSIPFDCTGCGGEGYSGWDTNPVTLEYEKQKCNICNGTGKLEAEITINWKPTKINENGNKI